MRRSFKKPNGKMRLGQSGQIVVEYVLLLTVAVGVAVILTRTMVNRDPDNPGYILAAWKNVITFIGNDKPDDIQR